METTLYVNDYKFHKPGKFLKKTDLCLPLPQILTLLKVANFPQPPAEWTYSCE